MKTNTVIINSRFKGPPNSGNGGYTSGLLARQLSGDVRVVLKNPPPLDTPLTLNVDEGAAQLKNGDQVVALAEATQLDLKVPTCLPLDVVTHSESLFSDANNHLQPVCFVCGPNRSAGDGLRIFTSEINEPDECVAAIWQPDRSLENEQGFVAPEFIWAALDCPGYFAHRRTKQVMLLGTITGSIEQLPVTEQTMIVMGWQIEVNNRKHVSGTALFDANGCLYAKSLQVWISV